MSKRFSNQLRLQAARGLVVEKVFQLDASATSCNRSRLQTTRGLVVEKVFQQTKVATSSRTRRRKGFPTSQGCDKLKDSSSKRFSNRLWLQPVGGLIVEKLFQPAMVAKSSSHRRRKGYPFSQCWKKFEGVSLKTFSNQPRLQQTRGFVVKSFPIGQGWKQREDSSSKRFSNQLRWQPARGLLWKGFPTSQCCNQLEDFSSKRFFNQPRLQPARGLVVEKVFQAAKVDTSSRNRRRKGFPTVLACKQLDDSWSKWFSNPLKLQPTRALVVEKTLRRKRICNQLKLQAARGLVGEKVFQPAKVATRSRTQLQKRFSNQLRLEAARGLVVEKVFPLAMVATSSRT